MSWVSTFGRRFLQAYTEGLAMTCPLHREIDGMDGGTPLPASINHPQDDVHAALRPQFARAFAAQTISQVRH